MATNLTSNTFSSTYKDDFADTKKFHKILFNSGRVVQARELTQAQTILQKQIERFGSNVFKEGAIVKAGGVTVNNAYEFIKLNNTSNTVPTDAASTVVGTTFTDQSGTGIKVEVIEVVTGSTNQDGGANADVLYVRYIHTSGGSAGENTIRMPNGVDMNNGSVTLTTATSNATGTGIRVSVAEGIFYIKGHFVFTEDQSLVVAKDTDTFTGDIGFKVVEDVVSTEDDTSLFDNQGNSPNLSSPGADRYRITLSLIAKDDITGNENFVFLVRLKEGGVEKNVTQGDPFNIPSKITAQRIKENSGNYVIKPFDANFATDSQNTHLLLNVSDGIGVVDGFRVARNASQIRVNKSKSTFTINNDKTAINFGNFVKVARNLPGSDQTNNKGLPDITNAARLLIKSAVDFGGSVIGRCRCRAISEDGANYKFHLFEIVMIPGQAFSSAKSIGTSATNYFDITLEGNPAVAVLHEATSNSLLFPLRSTRPAKIESISLTKQRLVSTVSVSSGAGSMPSLSGSETYANSGDWIIAKNDSDIHTGTISFTGGGDGATTADFTLGSPTPADGTYQVAHYVADGNATIRSKTLTQVDSESSIIDTDSSGSKFLLLNNPDIFDVQLIRDSNVGGVDLSSKFTLDNGQRDNFYDFGRLVLKSGETAPVGNVKVKYRFFAHGGGDFFAVSSYDSSALGGYQNIPNHTLQDGTILSLADCLDFRPVRQTTIPTVNSLADAAFTGGVQELPQPTDTVEANNSFYMQTAGKLVLSNEGVITFIKGDVGADIRSFPTAPDGTMALHNIVLGANTLNDSDVLITPVQNKRFTMKDIGTLEKRLERLEEAVTLSLLEIDTKNIEILDSSGVNRTRSGFVADNFNDQTFTDFLNPSYAAAIDPFAGVLHPSFNEDNIRMIFNAGASSNVVLKGDNVYIDYDSASYLDASLASTTVKINPFDFAQYNGMITLSPSSDEWRDVETITGKVTNGTQLDTKQAYLWNNHNWNWGGTSIDNLTVGSRTSQVVNATFNKVISDEKVRKIVNERIVETVLIPFQRPKKIHFRATGLRPNTQHFAFYDKNAVASYVREETFVRYATTTTDYGNTQKNIAAHPEGAGLLVSDVNGVIEGSFFVPPTTFRTGTREFALMDVSKYNRSVWQSNSRAQSNFTSVGTLEINEQDIVNTRILTIASEKVPQKVHTQQEDKDENHGGDKHYFVPSNGKWMTQDEMRAGRNVDQTTEARNFSAGGGRVSVSSTFNTERNKTEAMDLDADVNNYNIGGV